MNEITLGELPKNWEWTKLGNVVTNIVGGGTPSKNKSHYWDGDIPWLTVKDMRTRRPTDSIDHITKNAVEESSTNIIPEDTVIIATRIGLGKVIRVLYKAAINQDLKALIVPPGIDKGYLEYWFVSKSSYLQSIGSGTTVKGIRLEQVRGLDFPLAPPEQQKRIVAKIEELFSHIDAGIEALIKAKQLLKQYRQSVLKAAVTGELTKDLPTRQTGWRDASFRNLSDKRVPEKSNAFFAYVLECDDRSLYKGFSQDLFARINRHLEGSGSKWTKEHKPVALIHFEEFPSEKEAGEREKYFKSDPAREWINELRNQQKKKHEPAQELLKRILKERHQKWEEQQLAKFKAKSKIPKDDKWKDKYKVLALPSADDLPEIPASWQWVGLQHVFDVITDGDHQAPPKTDEGIPFLVIGDVNKGVINFGNKRFVPRSYYDGLAEIRRPRKGDLLYTVVGSFGIPVKVESDKEFCVQRHIAILKPSSRMSVNFLFHILSSGFVFKQAADVSTGTAQKTVPLGGLRELTIPLPPYEEQVALESLIEGKLDAIYRADKESSNIISMANQNKQSILASAFNGELVDPVKTDGTAKELLDKISEQKILEQTKKKPTKRTPEKKRGKTMSKRKIIDVLKESAGFMTSDQLFEATGYGEDLDEIENYYLELKQVVDDEMVTVKTNYSDDKKQENTFRYFNQL